MNRIDIVGLTLAEIALALLFSFLAIFVPLVGRMQKQVHAAGIAVADAKDLRQKLGNVRAQKEETEQQLAASQAEKTQLEEELETSNRKLRSIMTPSCVEINKAAGRLFTVTIRGSDRYDIDGHFYSFSGILQAYSPALSKARQDRCEHQIGIYYGRGVSGLDYDYSLRRFREHFYTKMLGPEP